MEVGLHTIQLYHSMAIKKGQISPIFHHLSAYGMLSDHSTVGGCVKKTGMETKMDLWVIEGKGKGKVCYVWI